MPKFRIKTTYTFQGYFEIEAENKHQAFDKVENSCGVTINNNIHSSLPQADVNWNFDVHPTGAKFKIVKPIKP